MQLKASNLISLSHWKWALLISAIVLFFGIKEKGWNNNYIHSDGLGYYGYLPAIFIYKDLSFNFIEKYEKKHYFPGQHYDFRQKVERGYVNRYYVGTALLQLPFFLVTHSSCLIADLDPCGYSHPYQYMVLIAACFYLFIGLWMLMKILDIYVQRELSILIPLILLLSTPLLFYTIFNPDFSHVYSFAVINLFIFHSIRYFQENSTKRLLLLFVWVGLIAIIRPINVMIILLLPFFAGNWLTFRNGILYAFRNFRCLVLGMIITLSIVFIQLLMYYLQTNSFLVYSYGPYGFNFLKPHFLDILFSYRKGLFIYTPILFISLGGFYFLFKRNFFAGLYLLLFLMFLIYILSSWDFWTYGMTYGQRPFIEYYSLFGLLLGLLIHGVRRLYSYVLSIFLVVFCLHNLIQISQHRHYILHWDEMDKEKYWKVFLRTDPIFYGITWNPIIPISDDTSGYFQVDPCQENTLKVIPLKASQIVTFPFNTDETCDSIDMILSFDVFPESKKIKNNKFQVAISSESNDIVDFKFEVNLRNVEPFKWNKVRKKMRLKNNNKGQVRISFENKTKYSFRLMNIKILKKDDKP